MGRDANWLGSGELPDHAVLIDPHAASRRPARRFVLGDTADVDVRAYGREGERRRACILPDFKARLAKRDQRAAMGDDAPKPIGPARCRGEGQGVDRQRIVEVGLEDAAVRDRENEVAVEEGDAIRGGERWQCWAV